MVTTKSLDLVVSSSALIVEFHSHHVVHSAIVRKIKP